MSQEARTITSANLEQVAVWCGGKVVTEYDSLDHTVSNLAINFQATDSVERARIGDTLIANGDGTYRLWKW